MRRGGANDKDCRPKGDGAAEGCTRVASPRFTPRFAPLWDVGRLYPSGESEIHPEIRPSLGRRKAVPEWRVRDSPRDSPLFGTSEGCTRVASRAWPWACAIWRRSGDFGAGRDGVPGGSLSRRGPSRFYDLCTGPRYGSTILRFDLPSRRYAARAGPTRVRARTAP